MGTDMHANVEVTEAVEHRRWVTAFAEVQFARDYPLFSLLAGVRSESTGVPAMFAPRGLPADASIDTRGRLELDVDDELAAVECEHACSKAQAEEWVAKGVTGYVAADRSRIFDPDAFAVSWLSTEDVGRVLDQYNENWRSQPLELAATLAAMRTFEAAGCKARLVMWFRH